VREEVGRVLTPTGKPSVSARFFVLAALGGRGEDCRVRPSGRRFAAKATSAIRTFLASCGPPYLAVRNRGLLSANLLCRLSADLLGKGRTSEPTAATFAFDRASTIFRHRSPACGQGHRSRSLTSNSSSMSTILTGDRIVGSRLPPLVLIETMSEIDRGEPEQVPTRAS